MTPRKRHKITDSEYLDLRNRITKINGFNMKVISFENRLHQTAIDIRMLKSNDRALRRQIDKLKEKTRKL